MKFNAARDYIQELSEINTIEEIKGLGSYGNRQQAYVPTTLHVDQDRLMT